MTAEQVLRQLLAADDDYSNKVLGCLIGGALGDALGYAVEFKKLPEIRLRYGAEGIQELELNEDGQAEVSDDTQMTLFTAEGVLQGIGETETVDSNSIVSSVQKQTLNWYGMQKGRRSKEEESDGLMRFSVLSKSQAPGFTCLSACAEGAVGTPENKINDSKGCGGVMRVAPIGLCTRLNSEEVFEIALRCAAQTHCHPTGYLSSGVMAVTVRELVNGVALDAAIEKALEFARSWQGADETIHAVEKARRFVETSSYDRTETITSLGKGWIAEEALAIGFYAACVGVDFCDVLRLASNHDGDSDSTASIAGQLYGAQHGMEGIPEEWVTKLDVLEPLIYVTSRIVES